MNSFRVVAIATETARRVRETLRSPGYGHPATVEVASGYGPCRHCLDPFVVGEEKRILFTCDPFWGVEPFPLPGPVFIHEEPCRRYEETAGFPERLREHPLTLIAYGAGRAFRAEERVGGHEAGQVVERFFAREDVSYVLVRDTDAGCYDFRIERGTAK